MKYSRLGSTGLKVSCLGFGTDRNIGSRRNETESREMVSAALDAGINLIDTADVYSDGAAERMLGKCLKGRDRSSYVLLTKVFGPTGPGPNDAGLSAKHIREACEASLARLRLDYVDLYLCHGADEDTPLEETVRAMGEVVVSGKARYWGVSNWPAHRIARANALAAAMALPGVVVTEDRYNLLYRKPEETLFPALLAEAAGCIAFSPLAHGMLAGIYKPGAPPPPGTRAAEEGAGSVTHSLYYSEENKTKAQELVRMAADLGTTAAALATAWCMAHPVVCTVLMGAWTVDELHENVRAADLDVPEDVLRRLDQLFPATSPG